MEVYGDVNYAPQQQVPYGSQELMQTLPLAPTSPAGQLAGNVGSFVPMTPAEALQAARVARQAALAGGKVAKKGARLVGEEFNATMLGERPNTLLGAVTPQPRFIVPPNVARQIDMPVNLPTSKEFLKAVENEPSAQITSEGLLINLKRSQNPQQSGLESVRTGVFYLPENQASNLKHYRGKTNYGGSEPIEGQTLYKNPLFVKGATGGKAPEMAYAQLTDKAQLKELQDDVFKAIHGPRDIKVDLVQQFLDKHAPDLKDYAHYIIDNSKQGNQLKYALQEAAVAHKVREAGHDAVLGYGKGRGDKGEFLSEVFDVRESHYPTPQGDFELMPQIQNQLREATLKSDLSNIKDKFKDVDLDVYENKGIINLSKIVIPKDMRSSGIGTSVMNELIKYADETGQKMVLTPSGDFGGNTARLKDFYKNFGFVENKGKNKDFSTRETMIRESGKNQLRQGR
jgi:predicted GNAT family acetyltransferase